MRSQHENQETKRQGGHVTEVKTGTREGVPIGFINGYIATWDLDEGLDRFVPGCFTDSLADHRARADRQIRLKDHHFNTIGGFPIETVIQDSRGLFGEGEVNLETQDGREVFSLARQGVLTDLSIGFTPEEFSFEEEGEVRVITKAIVWEGSVVDEPMNQRANITAVKARFRDLPVAPAETAWVEYTGKDRRAYIDGDQTAIATEIDGELVVVPERVKAVAGQMLLRSDLPRSEIGILELYFSKMAVESPFPAEVRGFYGVDDVRALSHHGLKDALRHGTLSKAAIEWLAGHMRTHMQPEPLSAEDIKELDEMTASIKGSRSLLEGVTV